MRLEELSLTNFKNIPEARLEFSGKVNCFLGNNGMDKSNMLDAIYFLSFCKSFSRIPDKMVIRRGEDFAIARGRYVRKGIDEELTLGLSSARRKTLKRGGKEYDRLNECDFNARRYNSTTTSFTAPDARCEEYPWLSPYAFCAGNPIRFTDHTGQRIKVYDEKQVEWEYIKKDGQYEFFNKNGDPYSGSSELMYQLYNALDEITSGPVGAALVDAIAQSDEIVTIRQPEKETEGNKFTPATNTITWNYNKRNGGPTNFIIERPSYIGLGHELAHSYDKLYDVSNKSFTTWYLNSNGKKVSRSEIFAGNIENSIRKEHYLPIRISYGTLSGTNTPDYNGAYYFSDNLYYFISLFLKSTIK